MNRAKLDLWAGIVVAATVIVVVFLALQAGKLSAMSSRETYSLTAKFDNIGGLKVRGAVKAAGFVVGRVAEIQLETEAYRAIVSLKIDQAYAFPRDTIATINTSGMLGEQYIGLEVGGDTSMLKDGDVIAKTQSAVVLEKLISRFLFSNAAGNGASPGKQE